MPWMKPKKLTVPIFGVPQSGKTYLLCALVYWARRKAGASIEQGNEYMTPRLREWQKGKIREKTEVGQKQPVSLLFSKDSLSDKINKDVLFETYDIAGDDYSGASSKSGQQGSLDYIHPTPYFINNINTSSGLICTIDIVKSQDKHAFSDGKLTQISYEEAANQAERFNIALASLKIKKINMHSKPIVFAFTKADKFSNKISLETLETDIIEPYFSLPLSTIGKTTKSDYKVIKVNSTSGVKNSNHPPVTRPVFKEVIKYITDNCV